MHFNKIFMMKTLPGFELFLVEQTRDLLHFLSHTRTGWRSLPYLCTGLPILEVILYNKLCRTVKNESNLHQLNQKHTSPRFVFPRKNLDIFKPNTTSLTLLIWKTENRLRVLIYHTSSVTLLRMESFTSMSL